MRKLLFIDTSYNFSEITKRNSLNVILSRDLNSYFNKVISVHPVANLTNKRLFLDTSYYKKNIINQNHIFYEFSSGKKNKIVIFEYISFLLSQIKMIFFLIQIIKKEKINYIKCGDINYSGIIALILSKITRVSFYARVGSNNNKIRDEIKKPLQPKFFKKIFIEKYFENLILKNCKHVFPANNDNANFVKSYLDNHNNITVIRYGYLINDCHFVERKIRKLTDNLLIGFKNNQNLIVSCISRFEEVKKVDHVISVFSELFKHNQKTILVLVGDGSLKKHYQDMVHDFKISDYVYFMGDKNQDWIAELLSITNLVLSPHTGRALCEAALAGCNIVGYDIDWQSEIITHKLSGFLANYGNKEKLIYYAKEILTNQSKYENFAVNIRKKALMILDKNKNIADEVNVFNNENS